MQSLKTARVRADERQHQVVKRGEESKKEKDTITSIELFADESSPLELF